MISTLKRVFHLIRCALTTVRDSYRGFCSPDPVVSQIRKYHRELVLYRPDHGSPIVATVVVTPYSATGWRYRVTCGFLELEGTSGTLGDAKAVAGDLGRSAAKLTHRIAQPNSAGLPVARCLS